jgi:hypothetical protein
MKKVPALLAVLALAFTAPVLADKDKGKGKGKGRQDDASQSAGHGKGGGKKFSRDEGGEIRRYFAANPGAREQLPPGLAKQGKIPPGWQKKIGVGQRVPDDIWAFRVPLPPDIVVRLPPPPPGVIHVRIQDHVLKVVEKTHEVLDDLGLPHPPTPRLPR